MKKEEVKSMRITNLKMVKGLIDFSKYVAKITDNKPLVFIELGSYIGESTNIFLNNLNINLMICIDAWEANEKYHEKDINQAYEIFKAQFQDNKKVLIYKGFSTDFRFAADIIYIDASHKYEDVLKDINFWYDRCTLISGHDYENNGKFGVKQAVDEFFKDKEGTLTFFEDTSWLFEKHKN